ncbi:MAG: D-tyrosyl-tRNA(Tyr) deacylase [Bacillales bacterium]|jgi:D-tyrosyl-tRNA(Tyr) deacylase|nr:D-tyrosyl-tRNA(Tyr) deacylase [Bacillales bacterium]
MKVVLQRVSEASVSVHGKIVGQVGKGFMLLVGVTHDDTESDARYLADKISGLRVFEDENEKMNLSIQDVGGTILSISQFTLYADTRKGRRPAFIDAARPEIANPLYEKFNSFLREAGLIVETGIFGANMSVSLVNDGPVTIVIESR